MTPHAPPRDVTDEASNDGLQLAKQEGDLYLRMVDYFLEHVAHSGGKREVGDYLVAVATEEAEPLWHTLGGRLELKEPAKDLNAHLEVVVMDRADHRFVPELDVNITVLQRDGVEVGTYHLPFHPTMYHYGQSIHISNEGEYQLKVCIEAPGFGRHDKTNGERYARPVTCTFDRISIKPGRKL